MKSIILIFALFYQTELVFKCINGNVFKWRYETELHPVSDNEYRLSEGGVIHHDVNGITLIKENEITVLKKTKRGLKSKHGAGYVGGDIVFGCKVIRRMTK